MAELAPDRLELLLEEELALKFVDLAVDVLVDLFLDVRDVLLPGALPNIATGLRLGLAYGWRALIAAEMLVGAHGLGFMIFSAQNFHLTARIMLGMAIIGGLWVLLDYFVLRPLEEATIARWGLVQR